MAAKRTIGFHLASGEAQSQSRLEGILDYVAKWPELQVRDFCYSGDFPDLSRPPPWYGKADGVVTCVPYSRGILPWLQSGGAPMVVTGSDFPKRLFSVRVNPLSLAKLAVGHFRELGRRHFAYLGNCHADGSHDRRRTLAALLAKEGFPLQSYEMESWLSGSYADFTSLDEAEPGLVALIRDAEKPLAVIAFTDRYAAVVCRVADALGYAVPEDVAVLGVGDSMLGRYSTPPISSISCLLERTGYEAARLLHGLVLGERPKRRVVWISATEIAVRQSTLGKQRAAVTDVDSAVEFVAKNACRGISVESVAAHVHMPKRTFELQFADATGQTVGAAIRDARLQRAKTLLETTELSIHRIARMVGMNGTPHLNQFFRRWMQMTPGEYRRQVRGGK